MTGAAAALYTRAVDPRTLKAALVLVTLASLAAGCAPVVHWLGGASRQEPSALSERLSPQAWALVDAAFADMDGPLYDYHVHLVGLGEGGEKPWVNPHLLAGSPKHVAKGQIYMSAARVSDTDPHVASRQYIARLASLLEWLPCRGRRYRCGHGLGLLAMDLHYSLDGAEARPRRDRSDFYVPSGYAVAAGRFIERRLRHRRTRVVPVASVHPYRQDAARVLERLATRDGVRFVKWLPNAQGMDASACHHGRLMAYYEVMRRHGMVLLTHVGEEQAVEAEAFQKLGDPARFRVPMALGVKVIMAHVGSLGSNRGQTNLTLFLELMADPRWRGRLWGELSATVQYNRVPDALKALLGDASLWPRLVNGSDYPLPAINALFRMSGLADLGVITPEQGGLLAEIYDFNPLLFDFVLKRTLRHPDKRDVGFPARIFQAHPDLPGGVLEPLPLDPSWCTPTSG